jgi:dTDP-4-amino-4,6-dideoxygalactose transaminase
MSYQSLFNFESALAEYTGAPYVVLTDGCTHAIELCMRYDSVKQTKFPAFTYLSVPMLMHHLDIQYQMVTEKWIGEYQFYGTRIWDSARRLERNMYNPGQFQCLSFGWTKPLQLGKVGAILLDDAEAYKKFSRQRSDGRDLHIPWESETDLIPGWHYCPTLENCERGLELLPTINQQPKYIEYPDCRKVMINNQKNI